MEPRLAPKKRARTWGTAAKLRPGETAEILAHTPVGRILQPCSPRLYVLFMICLPDLYAFSDVIGSWPPKNIMRAFARFTQLKMRLPSPGSGENHSYRKNFRSQRTQIMGTQSSSAITTTLTLPIILLLILLVSPAPRA